MVCRYFTVKTVKVVREWKVWEVVLLTSLTLDKKIAIWAKSIAQGHMARPRIWSWLWIFCLKTQGSFSHNRSCFQQFYHEISFFTIITVVSTGVTRSFLFWKMTSCALHFAKGMPSRDSKQLLNDHHIPGSNWALHMLYPIASFPTLLWGRY